MPLTYRSTLIYYDNHQVVLAADEVDTQHICLLVDDNADLLVYCCVPLSRSRLTALLSNQIDLRAAFLSRETQHWIELRTEDIAVAQANGVVEAKTGEIPDCHLPSEGLFVSPPPSNESLVTFSRDRFNIVSEVAVEPPESSRHSISAKTLSLLLDAYQGLVKRADTAVRKRNGCSTQRQRTSDAHIVDVCAFVPGSFIVRFESRAGLDLLGDSELEPALDLIDNVLSLSSDPEQVAAFLDGYKGHFVRNLIKILRIAAENKTYLRLGWARPSSLHARSTTVENRAIPALLEVLSRREEMLVETIVITGILKKADGDSGAWRVRADEDGKEHSGVLNDPSVSLSGLAIDSRYRVFCIERIEEEPFTGREITKLYATDFQPT